jgi:hypothetical protein
MNLMCVSLNMILKPYLKTCSSKNLVIDIEFGSQGYFHEVETFVYGLHLKHEP